jgi:AmmeMemoRadiSam system protein B
MRRPAVAGTFYPASPQQCIDAAAQFVQAGVALAGAGSKPAPAWRGAIVPHAGWICSGAIAGEAIGAMVVARGGKPPDVVVVFGAVHSPLPLQNAAMASHEQWALPGGVSSVPAELTEELQGQSSGLFVVDDRFHDREHAVEVELPLVQRAWPGARVLPIEVPLLSVATQIGQDVARVMQSAGMDAVYLASSDLTHYGPAYEFVPAGVGMDALQWAKENDRRLLHVVQSLSPESIVPEVRAHLNACGGGAIAAMLAAAREHGVTEARVLRHANSFETLRDVAPQRPDNAVGYAAVVAG